MDLNQLKKMMDAAGQEQLEKIESVLTGGVVGMRLRGRVARDQKVDGFRESGRRVLREIVRRAQGQAAEFNWTRVHQAGVVRLALQGESNGAIAEALDISVHAVHQCLADAKLVAALHDLDTILYVMEWPRGLVGAANRKEWPAKCYEQQVLLAIAGLE